MCIAEAIRRVNVEQDCSPRFQGDTTTAILATAAGFLKGNHASTGQDLLVPGVNSAGQLSPTVSALS
jgi:hypothetical protein